MTMTTRKGKKTATMMRSTRVKWDRRKKKRRKMMRRRKMRRKMKRSGGRKRWTRRRGRMRSSSREARKFCHQRQPRRHRRPSSPVGIYIITTTIPPQSKALWPRQLGA